MHQWPEVIKNRRVQTKNKMGFMMIDIEGASVDFVKAAATAKDLIVDIGCAYGITTLAALENSSCQVLAFDLEPAHLEALQNLIPEKDLGRVRLQAGRFPNDFQEADNSVDAIHISLVLHFLRGAEFEVALQRCFNALKPGGKLFVNNISPHLSILKTFLPIYQENLKLGVKWPGEIENLIPYLPEQSKNALPAFFHVQAPAELAKHFKTAGFAVDHVDTFNLSSTRELYEDSNDETCVSIIASKPKI